MRIARKLMLLGLMVAAAMALTASSAFVGEVEVVDERSTPVHCGAIGGTPHDPSGGCEFHVLGNNIDLTNHDVSPDPIASCTNEFTVNVDEDGLGTVTEATIVGPGICPFIVPCTDSGTGEDLPWTFSLEGLGDGTFDAVIDVCFDSPAGQCSGDYEVIMNAAQTEFHGHGPIVGSPCEVEGEWLIEQGDIGQFHAIDLHM